MVCQKGWTDKVRSGTKCRKCGTWWPEASRHNGKGKGYGKPCNRATGNQTWLESPPGLTKIGPLKKSKVQQEATDLLASSWTALSEETSQARRTGIARSFEDPHGRIATSGTRDCVQAHGTRAHHRVRNSWEIEGTGDRAQKHVRQEEPAPSPHRWGQGPIRQSPDQDARTPNQAGRRAEKDAEALRGLYEGRQSEPTLHGAQRNSSRAGADPNGGRILCTQLGHLPNRGAEKPTPRASEEAKPGSTAPTAGHCG